MEFYIDENQVGKEFVRVANSLLLRMCLIVNGVKINFTEIEFYYYSKNHQDAFTHIHDLDAGKWRFHNQGFDITLRGDTGFGGILIRGIEINGEFINGPRRVLFEIMRFLKPANEVDNEFGIIKINKLEFKIFRTFRHGLNEPNKNMLCSDINYFQQANYRFIVNPQAFNKSQFTGAESIARNFRDKQTSYDFLGYNLSS